MMAIYCMYIFDRNGNCLLYREWNRTRLRVDIAGEEKNLYGMLFALCNFCRQLSGHDSTSSGLHFYETGSYALHYYQTLTGLRFIMMTNPKIANFDVVQTLKHIYESIYVQYTSLNAFYTHNTSVSNQSNCAENSELIKHLDSHIKSLSIYS
mmetsp:Transcript_3091/g.5447  ORF Transcript_3091/g.5447 Transcript_3091/m.5447 type:complete len:152 (+) Transcript_3091:60-515(+)